MNNEDTETETRRAALVEKVADAINDGLGESWGYSTYGGNERVVMADALSNAATAALIVALEEAAKTIDEMPLSHPGNAAETALECAAAIRALIPKENT